MNVKCKLIKNWNKHLLFIKPFSVVIDVEMLPKRTWKEQGIPLPSPY